MDFQDTIELLPALEVEPKDLSDPVCPYQNMLKYLIEFSIFRLDMQIVEACKNKDENVEVLLNILSA